MFKFKFLKNIFLPILFVISLVLTSPFIIGAENPSKPIPEPVIDIGTLPEPVEEIEVDPAYSPDGNYLSYASNTPTSGILWLVDGNGTKTPVFEADNKLYQPVWSNDSLKIAFLLAGEEEPSGYLKCNVLVYDLSTEKVSKTDILAYHTRYEYQGPILEWFPDNEKLLVSTIPITIWDAVNSTSIIVSEPGEKAQKASLSPDGNKISYKMFLEGKDVLVLYNLKTSKKDAINSSPLYTASSWAALSPVWIDNDNLLLEIEHPDGQLGIHKIDLKNKKSAQLVYPGSAPQISSDGKAFAYISPKNGYENGIYDLVSGKIHVIPGTNGKLMKWSKDSSYLFLWDRLESMIVGNKGNIIKPVSQELGELGWLPDWSPTEKHLIITKTTKGKARANKIIVQ